MRKMVTFAQDWIWQDFLQINRIIPAGRRMKLNYPDDYVDENGNIVFGHWYGYGQSAVIPKEYFKNTT